MERIRSGLVASGIVFDSERILATAVIHQRARFRQIIQWLRKYLPECKSKFHLPRVIENIPSSGIITENFETNAHEVEPPELYF